MARMEGADPRKMGFGAGLFVRFVYWVTKRKLGKLPAPLQIIAHHPRNLWGYAEMEQAHSILRSCASRRGSAVRFEST